MLLRNPEEFSIEIDASADHVWQILAHRFDTIGVWATPINRSTAWSPDHEDKPSSEPGDGSIPTGRTCYSSIPGVNETLETIVEYDENKRTFTYVGSGMPAWFGSPSNTWFVEPLDVGRSKAGFRPSVSLVGFFGRILKPIFALLAPRISRQLLEDLKHFAETGEPSPRKRRGK